MDENIRKFLKHINQIAQEKKNKNKPDQTDNQNNNQIVDAIFGWCVCGYMAKYPICTKCGRSYPSNILANKENNYGR